MRILHVSDTHLFADDAALHYDRIDTAAALDRVLQRLADVAGDAPLDLVLHTGDASEDGSVASYCRLLAALEPFAAERGAALLVAMGNHDDPVAFAEVAGEGDHGGRSQDRERLLPGGVRVIVLDSSVPGAGYGGLGDDQLAWLHERLARRAPGGTVLAIHHPPLTAATPLLRALDLKGRDALVAALRDSDVRLVLSGHYHHPMSGTIEGIPVHVAPGITNVMDPLAPGGREQAGAMSGASVIELDGNDPSAAPIVTTAVWPSGGDTAHDPDRPVYDFDAATVRAIIDAAG